MFPEDEVQQVARSTPDNSPVNSRPRISLPYQSAISAWHEKDEYEREARYEPLRLERRAVYAEMIRDTQGRDVRGYDRDLTPEGRRVKKAEKSQAERDRRPPAKIEADKKAARDRAAASYERKKAAKAAGAEPVARMENLPTFGKY